MILLTGSENVTVTVTYCDCHVYPENSVSSRLFRSLVQSRQSSLASLLSFLFLLSLSLSVCSAFLLLVRCLVVFLSA
jgi:hypothetical protein